MGKGGGCVPSKERQPAVESENAADGARNEPILPEEKSHDASDDTEVRLKLFIVFYSMYGHVESLAKQMKKEVDSIDGVEGVLYRVPETLPPEVLEQMKAPPQDSEIPVISAAELVEADGILFGFPTRYGCMAA